jgi:hypothetical protein
MNATDAIRKRDRLARSIGSPTALLRGSLLNRIIRHKKGCLTCAKGGGHPASILSVNYPGGRNKQISLTPKQRKRAEQWLANYQKLKLKLEQICELNHILLDSDDA